MVGEIVWLRQCLHTTTINIINQYNKSLTEGDMIERKSKRYNLIIITNQVCLNECMQRHDNDLQRRQTKLNEKECLMCMEKSEEPGWSVN